jgi:hypothetical protein
MLLLYFLFSINENVHKNDILNHMFCFANVLLYCPKLEYLNTRLYIYIYIRTHKHMLFGL